MLWFITTNTTQMWLVFDHMEINYQCWSRPPEVFLGKVVLKICSKFPEEHPCRSVISIKLQSSFIEITLRHKCSPVKLLHIFRTSFFKNTSGWLLLLIIYKNWHLLAINAQQSSSGLLPKHWFKFSYFPWFLGQNYKTLSFPLWFFVGKRW